MAQGLDAEMVRQHYARISDEELIRIVTEDAVGITPEAKEIALNEVQRRNLHPSLLQGIDAQHSAYSDAEINALSELIQELPCPVCRKMTEKLNGTLITETISVIFFTSVRKKILIACPTCLDKAIGKASTKTALLGWWGLPWGIIRTIQSLSKNASFRKHHHAYFPNDALSGYVRVNAGKITVFKDDKHQLSRAIRLTD